MYTAQQFLDSIAHETRVCQHLATKVDPQQLDYRPVEGSRSTIELMRYLTWCVEAPVEALLNKDWSKVSQYAESTNEMTLEQFSEAMDQQLAKTKEWIGGISEEEFMSRSALMPWGAEVPLGAALVDTTLKFISAYRLQLFQCIKVCGATELGTANAWLGVDAPA